MPIKKESWIDKVPNPCFILFEDKLRANLSLISKVADEAGVEIILAFKGFAMWKAFPIVREYIHSATASSLNELLLCAEEMKSKAHTYCVAIADHEIETLCKWSSHLTFNSLAQFAKFQAYARDKGVSCGLRVNPEYSEVETDLYNPASPHSRLGITRGSLHDELPEGVEGLHFHALCENDSFTFERTLKAFEEKFGSYLGAIKWVNFGGGHLMTRNGYDVNHLIAVLRAFRSRHPHLKVILEPGSAFAWDAGVLLARVLDVVENNGVKTANLNVSFTAHMPDTLEMPYQPRVTGAWEALVNDAHVYRLGGNSCLSGDFKAGFAFDVPLVSGDPIIFEDMIHYTMVKTSTFNGVPHPAIGMLNVHGEFELFRGFGYADYKNRLS